MKNERPTLDDEFIQAARALIAISDELTLIGKEVTQIKNKYDLCRARRADICKRLGGFVGNNVTTKTVVIGQKLVRVEHEDPSPIVNIEDVLIAPEK